MSDDRSVLLVSDLDGTYLDPDGSVPLNASVFGETLARLGIDFVVATSRSPHGVVSLLGHVLPPFRAVCSDGATTIGVEGERWQVLGEELFEPARADQVMKLLAESDRRLELFIFAGARMDFRIFHLSQSGEVESLRVLDGELGEARPISTIRCLDELNFLRGQKSIRAVSWFASKGVLRQSASQIQRMLQPEKVRLLFYPEVRFPNYWWLDVLPDRCTKACGLECLLSTNQDDPWIIALGNGDNDVPLFDAVDVSYCPSDSSPAALAAARFVLDAPGGTEFLHHIGRLLSSDRYLRGGPP